MNLLYIVLASLLLLMIVGYFVRGKRAKNRIVRVIADNRTGCRRCLKRCRHKALDVVDGGTRWYAVLNPDNCTACGDCVAVCKFNALELGDRKRHDNHDYNG